jgi:MarR family transcriptional regulator, transcriptional regulator for hemolysin
VSARPARKVRHRTARSAKPIEGLIYDPRTPEVLIQLLARIGRLQFTERAKEHGIARSQWQVLNRLSVNKGITLSELAALLEVATVTTGRLVDRLEIAGWAERRPSTEDRREKHIFLTKNARNVQLEVHAIADQLNKEPFSVLTKQEYNEICRLLTKVHESVSSNSR